MLVKILQRMRFLQKFENGILQLKVPKKDGQSAENKKCITIEG